MPVYVCQHVKEACSLGNIFEVTQSTHERPLTQCPNCEGPVRKLISRSNISTPKTNSELRDLGFTKLVRRDDGVYENVTARDGESKVMLRDKSEKLPNLERTISD